MTTLHERMRAGGRRRQGQVRLRANTNDLTPAQIDDVGALIAQVRSGLYKGANDYRFYDGHRAFDSLIVILERTRQERDDLRDELRMMKGDEG